jgi:hypothetical protein
MPSPAQIDDGIARGPLVVGAHAVDPVCRELRADRYDRDPRM